MASQQTTVITSDHVYTDAAHPDRPLAVVVEGGRVRELLPRDRARELSVEGADVRDYGDAFVCPGFHDAHQHVLHTALFPSQLADRYVGTSERDYIDHLRAFAATHPGDGWMLCQGWRADLWDPPVWPTRDSLDAAFDARPVACCDGDLHAIWLNSAGMAALGITEETQPPAGGIFDRDEHGRLTGVLHEAASMVYTARVFQSLPMDQLRAIYLDYFNTMLSRGVTAVCDMALCAVPGADNVREDVYEGLLADGRLPLRVSMFPQLIDDLGRIKGLQSRLTGDVLRAPGLKQFFDGVSSAHTAWLADPYANPRFPGDCGRPTIPTERMRSLVMAAAAEGIAVRIHAIGDRAVHEGISIFRDAYERFGAPQQGVNSLEHIENLLPGDVEALRDAHLVASVQPQHVVIDVTQPDRDLGPGRARDMWPFADYLRAGVPMAFGTDSPCVPALPMQVLSCAVTREVPETCQPAGGWNPHERIGMAEAINAFTRGSAYVAGRGGNLGTLRPGMLADVAVLDRDLMAADPEQIQDTKCLATYVGGSLAWER
jgi:predicted amidohydrolase YtcJ